MELWDPIREILNNLAVLAASLVGWALRWSLVIAWLTWCLCAVNWNHFWPVLARGGWVVVLLACVAGALAWSQVFPRDVLILGILPLANFWWQLAVVAVVLCITLFCGWLQGVMKWEPAAVVLDPVPESHGESHARSDGHHG